MGILGFQKLQTEECTGGTSNINIVEKLSEWKTAHPEKQPILVVRLKEVLMSVVQLNVKAAIFGGSHRFYHEQLDKFFQPLLELDVKLVFFGGGAKSADKLKKMTHKSEQTYKKQLSLLDHIDKTGEMKLCSRPELRTCLGLYEEGIARKYGDFILATGSLNKEIVRYCRDNENVVAVLAKDSDFLIYDLRHVEYWSCGIEDLNFRDKTTISFNHAALLTHLSLTPHQFHVMVSIVGVILDDPKTHCSRVKRGIPNMSGTTILIIRSDLVRKNVPADIGDERPKYGDWTNMVFYTNKEEYSWLIEKQFKKYDILANEVVAQDDGTNILRKYKFIWSVVNDNVIYIDHSFMDVSRWNSDPNAMSSQKLFVLALKRAMGIVLHPKREQAPKRQFLMKGHEDEHFKILQKVLSYSSLDVPPIEKLIDEAAETNEEFINMKWNLLFWILHFNGEDDVHVQRKIRDLPREIAPVVLTALYLLRERQLTPMESDTIIISENRVQRQAPGTDCVEYPTKVDGRTIRIAHLYVYMRTVINRCFLICGIDLFDVPVTFDGVHFHKLLIEFGKNPAAFENDQTAILGFRIADF